MLPSFDRKTEARMMSPEAAWPGGPHPAQIAALDRAAAESAEAERTALQRRIQAAARLRRLSQTTQRRRPMFTWHLDEEGWEFDEAWIVRPVESFPSGAVSLVAAVGVQVAEATGWSDPYASSSSGDNYTYSCELGVEFWLQDSMNGTTWFAVGYGALNGSTPSTVVRWMEPLGTNIRLAFRTVPYVVWTSRQSKESSRSIERDAAKVRRSLINPAELKLSRVYADIGVIAI